HRHFGRTHYFDSPQSPGVADPRPALRHVHQGRTRVACISSPGRSELPLSPDFFHPAALARLGLDNNLAAFHREGRDGDLGNSKAHPVTVKTPFSPFGDRASFHASNVPK